MSSMRANNLSIFFAENKKNHQTKFHKKRRDRSLIEELRQPIKVIYQDVINLAEETAFSTGVRPFFTCQLK